MATKKRTPSTKKRPAPAHEAPPLAVAPTPAAANPAPPATPARGASTGRLSALDAAARVLGERQEALSCKQLIEAMAAQGYWTSPAGQTPAATLYAAVQREIKRKGAAARFQKAAPGKFKLA
jgi:hypothetical protein